MRKVLGAVVAMALVVSARAGVLAAAPDANAVIDKAIKALGGEAKIASLEGKPIETKAKGKLSFGGAEGDFTTRTVSVGLNRFRQEFDGDFGGNQIKGVTVVDGDKGWRNFAGNSGALEGGQLADQKRTMYLGTVPMVIVPLKGKDFKVESAKEEKVDNKAAVALKIIGPDKKDFTLYFDQETGLPLKMTAKVAGLQGDEFQQETTYGDFKDFDGIKRATKVDSKRDGEKFIEIKITDMKVLDKVDPKTFAEPAGE
jgi:hypothetical protein